MERHHTVRCRQIVFSAALEANYSKSAVTTIVVTGLQDAKSNRSSEVNVLSL
jgi:hypothetical protein